MTFDKWPPVTWMLFWFPSHLHSLIILMNSAPSHKGIIVYVGNVYLETLPLDHHDWLVHF